MRNRSIRTDTIFLSIIQFSLDTLSLAANLWLTNNAGSAAVGMIALVGAFFSLASMTAGGSGFLCASRFVSEEIGKNTGAPEKIFRFVLTLSLSLAVPAFVLIILFSDFITDYFFHTPDLSSAVCILAAVLPLSTAAACLKGWCNAVCRVKTAALCDALEFIIKTAFLVLFILSGSTSSQTDVPLLCTALASGMAAGSAVSLVILLADFFRHRIPSHSSPSVSFGKYARLAVPVILGGCLTSALSTANDALIPVTLRQSGSSAQAALSQFGVFESVVIPVIFFPTAVLCVLSGILVPEAARAEAGRKKERLVYLAGRSLSFTMYFSAFVSAALLTFGERLAEFMCDAPLAGRMIQLLAPVIPFIYLEIILEAIIKGTGRQQFSMLNYLAEYTVRISCVLIFIPLTGFYGIVISYYASNIFGNCMRLCKTVKITGLSFSVKDYLLCPFAAAAASFFIPQTIIKCTNADLHGSIFGEVCTFAMSAFLFVIISVLLNDVGKGKLYCRFQRVK